MIKSFIEMKMQKGYINIEIDLHSGTRWQISLRLRAKLSARSSCWRRIWLFQLGPSSSGLHYQSLTIRDKVYSYHLVMILLTTRICQHPGTSSQLLLSSTIAIGSHNIFNVNPAMYVTAWHREFLLIRPGAIFVHCKSGDFSWGLGKYQGTGDLKRREKSSSLNIFVTPFLLILGPFSARASPTEPGEIWHPGGVRLYRGQAEEGRDWPKAGILA